VNDNFCVPDSLYDPEKNPDGKYKLAQLVRMNEALYDMATFFNIPLTSGKDSMKNDFKKGDIKISVPPTILYSMVAKIDDVRKTLTSDFKEAGDVIYQVGKTYNELGGSECYALFDVLGANVPKVRKEDAKRIYEKMAKANEAGLLASVHDMSDGGLAVALAESAFGGRKGCDIVIADTQIGALAELYSESHSRFVVSVAPDKAKDFKAILGDDCTKLGTVHDRDEMTVNIENINVIKTRVSDLHEAWSNGLRK
jgi:phosphoribosylformylglycinamidine synthase